MAGIYIHIPFCKQSCHYCNFHFSTSTKNKDKVLDAIENEIPGYKYLSKTFKNFNPVTFKKISHAMCNLDTNGKLKDISVPTLIVATPDDPGAPTYISRRMAEYISGSELHWLEPAQHLSSLEHIEPFNLIVKNFLLKQR